MALQSASHSLLLRNSPVAPPPPSHLRSGRVSFSAPAHSRPRPVRAIGGGGGGDDAPRSTNMKRGSVPNANYVVPLDSSPSSLVTRPLVEILRDLNKRIPDTVLRPRESDDQPSPSTSIAWYHANRMLSFYAPGWCGEVRDVVYSDNGSVTVVYRVTIRGSDGEAHRDSSGTVSCTNNDLADPVAAAEEIAFCRACARFGLGLYLYHEE